MVPAIACVRMPTARRSITSVDAGRSLPVSAAARATFPSTVIVQPNGKYSPTFWSCCCAKAIRTGRSSSRSSRSGGLLTMLPSRISSLASDMWMSLVGGCGVDGDSEGAVTCSPVDDNVFAATSGLDRGSDIDHKLAAREDFLRLEPRGHWPVLDPRAHDPLDRGATLNGGLTLDEDAS